jgi:hypothetical protein
MYKLANTNKYIKSVANPVEISGHKGTISDIMVKMKGPGEDRVFASSKVFQFVFRILFSLFT